MVDNTVKVCSCYRIASDGSVLLWLFGQRIRSLVSLRLLAIFLHSIVLQCILWLSLFYFQHCVCHLSLLAGAVKHNAFVCSRNKK